MYEGETAVNSIEADCTVLLQHLIAMGYCMSNVFVMGRSIGTGPAICLAGLYSFGGLTLLSPFLSVCRLVKEVYGLLAGALLKEPFDNEQRVENINCPCLIVHGLQDKLINYEHALSLGSKFKGGCKVQLVEAMTHSVFRI